MAEVTVLAAVADRWDRWVGSPAGIRRRRIWAGHRPALAGWTADQLRAPVFDARVDAMQAGLVELTQAGDDDAALTLMVQLRPGLGSLSWWLARSSGRVAAVDDAGAEVLSTFALQLLAHPLERRPALIAANLLLDTRQRLWRASCRDTRLHRALLDAAGPHRPDVVDPAPAAGPDRPESVVDALAVAAAVRAALGRIPDPASRSTTAEAAYRAWVLDRPNAEIGSELGLGREAVSSRLCRLRSEVRRELDSVGA